MSAKQESGPKSGIDRLLEVVAALRAEGGCPWDREQTLDSLKQYLIEETYEVIDAVESGDAEKHKEELGDVLLHILLHAQIRSEKGEFEFDDVANAIADKLVRRHPHVFGATSVSGSDQVLRNWEAIKLEEREKQERSLLAGVPRHLPALQKAQRVQSRAARVGFDWTDVKDVMAKIAEELEETKEAIGQGDARATKHEIGDLLFALVNLARFTGIDPEDALQQTTGRFIARFQAMEKRVQAEGRELSDCSLDELERHWQAVKRELQ